MEHGFATVESAGAAEVWLGSKDVVDDAFFWAAFAAIREGRRDCFPRRESLEAPARFEPRVFDGPAAGEPGGEERAAERPAPESAVLNLLILDEPGSELVNNPLAAEWPR